MFRRTLIVTALLAIALIGTAGPASAFDGWCIFDPIGCIAADLIAEATEEDSGEDAPQRVEDSNRNGMLGGVGFVPGVGGFAPGGSEPSEEAPIILLELPDSVKNSIREGGTVDLGVDLTIPVLPEDEPEAPAETSEPAEPAADESDGADRGSAGTEDDDAAPAADQASEAGVGTGTTAVSSPAAPSIAAPVASTGSDPISGEPRAMVEVAGGQIGGSTAMAALMGAAGALLVMTLLGGVFVAGRRSR